MLDYFVTFVAVFLTDVIYIYFLKSVQHNRPFVAALWSVVEIGRAHV